MKTTLEIPDPIFRRAKARAAERGIPFREYVTRAVEEKLRAEPSGGQRPWLRMAGKLRHLHDEAARINARIEQEFEVIEPEDRL